MARNLIRGGNEVVVWNRTKSKAQELARDGADVASTIREAVAGGIVITMLADDAAVEQVVFGHAGVLASLPPGGLHVSMSTISRALSERLQQAHSGVKQAYVAAPVFGRPEAAENKQLVIVAAGNPADCDRARPLLEAMGRKVVSVGPEPWKANVFKLCGNFTIASMLETLSEAFATLGKSGLDPGLFLDIVNGDLFRSPVYENYGRLILGERFEPAGFKARLGLKDMRLVLAAADTAESPMPFASVVHDNYLALVAGGDGDIDWAALGKLAAERAGLAPKTI